VAPVGTSYGANAQQILSVILERAAAFVDKVPPSKFPLVDEYWKQLLSGILSPLRMHVVSADALQDTFSSDRRNVSDIIETTACAWTIMYRREAHRMLKSFADSIIDKGGTLLTFTDVIMYDSTPMKTTVKDMETLEPVAPAVKDTAATDEVQISCIANGWFKMYTAQGATYKLLQTSRSCSALAEVDGVFVRIHVRIPLWLQAVARGTGEAYYGAVKASDPQFGDIASRFNRSQRLVCTDADGAVERCERKFGLTVESLRLKCEVHAISTMSKTTAFPLEPSVSSFVNFSLCLAAGATMQSLRSCVREVLTSRFQFRRGVPNPDDLLYNVVLLDTFCSGLELAQQYRRSMLLGMFNSRWDSHEIVHVCNGCCRGRAVALKKACAVLTSMVFSCEPPTWPRHKWLGVCKALDWIGLALSVHPPLFKDAFLKYAEKQPGGAGCVARAREGLACSGAPLSGVSMMASKLRDGFAEIVGKGPSVTGGPEQAIEHFGLSAEDVRKDEIGKKKGSTQNSLFVAIRWFVLGHPLPAVICLKGVLLPFEDMLFGYVRTSSISWERSQLRSAAEGKGREYRILRQARHMSTTPCMDKIWVLFGGDRWAFGNQRTTLKRKSALVYSGVLASKIV